MDREKVMSWLEGLAEDESMMFHSFSEVGNIARSALELLKEQQQQIDRLLEESASNAEMAEGMKELLKEQEARQVNISQTHCGMKYGLCPRCEKQIDTLVNPHYCGNCGQELKWK